MEVYAAGEEPELLFGRGFTGHEHLTAYGLINMNARLYDPVVGRFLSPDPYVQAPDFSQAFNRYSYCWNNPLRYVDEDGEIAWFIPIIYFAIYAAIEYGTQVYHNYQASKEMEKQGYDPMSGKDIWFGQIDWFDVVIDGVGGAVSSCVPSAAPWIMYGSPWVTNSINLYGDGRKQTVFDGTIPFKQYALNTITEVGSAYMTNVIKTGLATDTKDIWNPDKHTKYFSKETKGGKIITGRSWEDILQQATTSTISYTIKVDTYIEFNQDRLFIDEVPKFLLILRHFIILIHQSKLQQFLIPARIQQL